MAYKKWFDADGKLAELKMGWGGEYVKFKSLVLPVVERTGVGDALVRFDVYRDEKAAKLEDCLPFRELTFTLPAAMITGFPLVNDPAVMAQFIYEHAKAFIPELSDAEDLL